METSIEVINLLTKQLAELYYTNQSNKKTDHKQSADDEQCILLVTVERIGIRTVLGIEVHKMSLGWLCNKSLT